jgi:hypothetical protein
MTQTIAPDPSPPAHAAGRLQRALRWWRRPAAERRRLLVAKLRMLSALPFRAGRGPWLNVFLGYQPDAQVHFDRHPEVRALFERFIAHNRANNGGDMARLWSLALNLKQVLAEGVEGDFAELGVWRGNTAAVLAHYAQAHGRRVLLFDTFEGFDPQDLDGIDARREREFTDTSVALVEQVLGPARAVCELVPGRFPGSVTPAHAARRFAAVSLDCDLHEPMRAGLEFFYPRLAPGGLLMLHDYGSGFWPGATRAIDDFCAATGERLVLLPDKSGSAFIRRSRPGPAAAPDAMPAPVSTSASTPS